MQPARPTLLLIMRHGPAEPAGGRGDAGRRLTPEGRKQVQSTASQLAQLLPAPQAIWSSPLARAHETAELLAAAFASEASEITPLLEPGFEPWPLVDALAASGSGPFVVVAHAPDVSRLTGWLLGVEGQGGIAFGSGTSALVSYSKPGEGILHTLYPLETFTLKLKPHECTLG